VGARPRPCRLRFNRIDDEDVGLGVIDLHDRERPLGVEVARGALELRLVRERLGRGALVLGPTTRDGVPGIALLRK
jgi:hypothetical protein